MTEYVDLETARAARGVRLVTLGGIPSPWSEAAKGIFRVSGVPFVAVRLQPGDKAVREWTRSRNAPAVMFDDEPARTGWAEILELAERVAPKTARSLVPSAPQERVRMYGLAHEVVGEGGLLWASRILTIDEGLSSDGARDAESLALLDEALSGREYFFFEDRPSALDVYVAAAVNLFALPDAESCAMWPPIRAAFESMRGVMPAPSQALVALRNRMYERHLELPITL